MLSLFSLNDSHGPTFLPGVSNLVPNNQGSSQAKTSKGYPFPTTVKHRPVTGTCTSAHYLLQRVIRLASPAMRSRSSLGTLAMASHVAICSASSCPTSPFSSPPEVRCRFPAASL
jgi:hypothetical protein